MYGIKPWDMGRLTHVQLVAIENDLLAAHQAMTGPS